MHLIFFMLALGLLAAARFCVWPARTYRAWWVALVATELGHIGVLLALGIAFAVTATATFGVRGAAAWETALAVGTVVVALVAAGFFARPVWAAWRLRNQVSADITAAFGATPLPVENLWSWRRLWRWPTRVEPTRVETFTATGAAHLPLDFYPARPAAGSTQTSRPWRWHRV